ncbi:AMP-binding protein [Streptomyces sp. HNM0574]|uniref:class I adenylate-forming enzyme family protein n=1 Tax=Streptomyces sp. HNM0574 TaxID=2714954 RepID=UPI00146EFC4D|nr:AMP-binding protein [Streptomyces sp. HNM0574]NLU68784.1 long-chain fatty acid--CoA ligase [Streptomyces sp. HNM0574]
MSLTYLHWRRQDTPGERPCVGDEQLQFTYDEFGLRVEAVAEQFAQAGVGPGSVVAVMLPNRVELLVCLMAAWRVGAAATPVNPVFTAAEADYQISDSGAVLVVNAGPGAPDGGRPSLVVDDLRQTPEGHALPEPSTDPADRALLIYTSGSTGRPKGVILDHANIDAMVASISSHLEITADDHCLLVLPLFHVNAICVSFLSTLRAGGRLSVLSRFHPKEFLAAVERLRPTFFSAVPTIYAHLVGLSAELTADTSSVRVAICGAAPASEELLAAVEKRFGFPVVEGYGLTEGSCASTSSPLHAPRRPGTVGVALPGQRVAVMAGDGTLLPPGERGEIVVQGANVMRGYLGRPEATAETLRGGWLHTGDVGVLDEDGYLRIVDRIKDMIIRGGENLYPKEIESVLHQHPAVQEAAVVGAPHAVYGEVPVAYVAAYPGMPLVVDELRALCAERLTKVKNPVAVHVLDTLPKNPVGKLDKPALRARLAAAPADPTPQGA